jgi:hypothetical protein
MNWYKLSQNDKEYIIGPVVYVNNKTYTGATHLDALQKAINDSELFYSEDGILIDKKGKEFLNVGQIENFITNKGRIVDFFEKETEF